MNWIKRFPATFSLLLLNVLVFIIIYLEINSFAEPAWALHLLNRGAEYNPYTLDGEWYRIFTHMFLHRDLVHLFLNMYGLYVVGMEVETETGTKKFLWVYFLTGIAAALTSLYWSLFAIGVGASGAIFGLFGFSLVTNLIRSRQMGHSMTPILINFAIFMGINLYLGQAFRADTSAHLGGLACGIVLALLSMLRGQSLRKLRFEYAFIPLFIILYFALPRYQVTYYKFFQYVLATEDSTEAMFSQNHPDAYYLPAFQRVQQRWDTALHMLDAHAYLPEALHSDTTKLRYYISLRKKENAFRMKMAERESYIYMDSIDIVRDSMRHFGALDFPLAMRAEKKEEAGPKEPPLEKIEVLYNDEWEEIPGPAFTYYRHGTRDSLGRWQGSLRDYYANGQVQMKGSYTDDEKNGIFIYYSDHQTYESAGRYRNDLSVGKWESYHRNGKLESEVYYTDRYFLKNLWDSAGNQFVKDGFGRVMERHVNGVIANEGEYRDGYKEGYWYGRHPNGSMYYEENYFHGRLVNGRSRNLAGETFTYDESSFFPLPEGGYKKLKEFLQIKDASHTGTVRLSFRVTTRSTLTDFKVLKSVSRETDERAKQILKAGPRWIPAKDHGHQAVDGFAQAEVVFTP
jgi:membrane associated rhomboid family serine protease/antitoxin component YwqK of YwqJK toxin-antitoxin module